MAKKMFFLLTLNPWNQGCPHKSVFNCDQDLLFPHLPWQEASSTRDIWDVRPAPGGLEINMARSNKSWTVRLELVKLPGSNHDTPYHYHTEWLALRELVPLHYRGSSTAHFKLSTLHILHSTFHTLQDTQHQLFRTHFIHCLSIHY